MRAALVDAGLADADLAERGLAGGGPGTQRFFFEKVTEKSGVNRVHIDLNAAVEGRATQEEVDAEVERILALGATVVISGDPENRWGSYPEYHWVFADPAGNEFCVQ